MTPQVEVERPDRLSKSVRSNLEFIRLEHLAKSYMEGPHERCVLCDLTAAFAEGEFVAILGKSGSGKSTLLNVISGIDCMDSGSVWFGDQNLTTLDDRSARCFDAARSGSSFNS